MIDTLADHRPYQIMNWSLKLLIVIGLFALIGCGPSGPPKYSIEGLIKYDGQSLPKGTLTLIPSSSTAKTVVVPIENGTYSADVTEGDWTVNIQAVRETGPVIKELREAPREQYLPREYNSDSQLKITVPSDQPTFNFDLEP